MTLTELIALLPLLILASSVVIVLLVIAFYRNHPLTAGLTGLGLLAALAALPFIAARVPQQATALLIIDHYALYYMGLLLTAALVVVCLAYGYLANRSGHYEELYLLLLAATLGALVLVVSSHFVSFFLGLEILTVSLYTLIAYLRTADRSIEAGLKYLVLAGVSSAFLLFGMALLYADLGTMAFNEIGALLIEATDPYSRLLPVGLGMMVIGVGFKLALVPFHMWTPDVYEGASAPVTAFIATVSKGGMVAFLLRYFGQIDFQAYPALFWVFALLAAASMLGGNLLALLQSNVKRLLAYSSIAHLGYLLVAFLAGGDLAVTAATYYLTAYFVTILGAFGIVALLSGPEREAEKLEDYQALLWRRPWAGGSFTLVLLSLAGIPLTAGFIGKFYLVAAGIGSALWTLVLILILSSAIGLYYYLRVIVTMGMPDRAEARAGPASLSVAGSAVLTILMVLLLWFGVYPTPLIDMIQEMVGRLV